MQKEPARPRENTVVEESPERLVEWVAARYGVSGASVRVARAPYRICPLGAHIDHQLGTVTAMALDRAVQVAFVPAPSREVRLSSLDFPGETCFDLGQIPDRQPGDWGNFARGAARILQRDYRLQRGIWGVTAGRLDAGGLSSSAAISVALLLAMEQANGVQVPPEKNVELALAIENDYLGLRIGILDQAAILLSRRHELTWVDCRDRSHRCIAPPGGEWGFAILIASSGRKQALVGTDYNRRVDECAAAAERLLRAAGRSAPPVLRNVRAEEYARHRHRLRGAPARRAEHFFGEMRRVAAGVDAWRQGDWLQFGRLVSESGRSSIENYECGCPPLVDLVQVLNATPGVLGARFSGAGFRGCCLALVDPAAAETAAEQAIREYRRRQPELADQAWCLICQSGPGAGLR